MAYNASQMTAYRATVAKQDEEEEDAKGGRRQRQGFERVVHR